MPFISETTEVEEVQELWEHISVDETLVSCEEFVELFKKNCSVFDFETESSRRIVIELFLREIVSQFPAFQVICEYHMTLVNEYVQEETPVWSLRLHNMPSGLPPSSSPGCY
jgi:hypothetical protein